MNHRPLKCVIVDDEPTARQGLRSYVDKLDWLQCTAMPGDTMELDSYLNASEASSDTPDIIFIDIEMPGMSGLDYLESRKIDAAIIIVTAYEQYALRGYELNVTDYLLKPVSAARFMKAAEKARQFINMRHGLPSPGYIFLRADRKILKIDTDEIIYAEGLENYVIVHTTSQRIVTRTTMKNLLANLPSGRFMQVHKSYIVNLSKITAISGHTIRLDGLHEISVSKSMRATLLDYMSR